MSRNADDLKWSKWFEYLESQFVSPEAGRQAEEGVKPKQEPAKGEPQREVGSKVGASVQAPAPDPSRAVSPPAQPVETPLPPQTSPAGPPAQAVVEMPSSSEVSPVAASSAPAPKAEEGAPADRVHSTLSINIPHFFEYVPLLRHELGLPEPAVSHAPEETPREGNGSQQTKEALTQIIQPAPRFRRRKEPNPINPEEVVSPGIEELWLRLPKHLRLLLQWGDDQVAQKYYKQPFKEAREALIARLTDPVLSLEDTARLLGVCPTTVRRYTDRGWLRHFRTKGKQRRFRLSDIVAFLEAQEARRRKRTD